MSPLSDLFIHNRWKKGSGAPLTSLNPATSAPIWQGNAASEEEVDEAIMAAQAALPSWSSLSFETRAGYLESFRHILTQSLDFLAQAIAMETGKPLWESKTEVNSMIAKIPLSLDAYRKRCADLHAPHPTASAIARPKPHGVIAVFGPFNFPGHLPNGHIVPALLAGNTVVFKPSEYTPYVAALTVHCWEQAKLPPGVLNLVQGGRDTGIALANHPNLNGLFFTGSWPTGRSLSEQFARTPDKILALELGGNNPLVISRISDIHAATIATLQSAYATSGQRCTCARRLILIEGSCPPKFLDQLLQAISSIRIGPFTDHPEPFMGPIISPFAAKKLLEAQDHLIAQGGKPLLPLKLLHPYGAFLSPGLIDVTAIRNRPDEEYFGPLLQLIRVPDLSTAIQEANNTRYGLCAGLFSDDPHEYEQFYKSVKAGVINWNTPLTGASSALPFGGIGHSGNHRPSAFYAADYCSYPVASLEADKIVLSPGLPPGLAT